MECGSLKGLGDQADAAVVTTFTELLAKFASKLASLDDELTGDTDGGLFRTSAAVRTAQEVDAVALSEGLDTESVRSARGDEVLPGDSARQ